MEKAPDDLFELYFQAQLTRLEPPAIFHRWSMISILGAWLGRQCWLPFGSSKIHPNMYIMFVGDPGSRKSTAIKEASRLLRHAGYTTFAPKKTSKEQYLADLTDEAEDETNIDTFSVLPTASTTPRESFINADEFNVFMGPANLDFQDILGDMWDWDDPNQPWEYRLKNSKHVSIYQPTISILGGNTPNNFLACFPPASIGSGFLSRMVLVYGEKTGKKISFPSDVNAQIWQKLLDRLQAIRIRVTGEITKTRDAHEALSVIYTSWPEMEDMRFSAYGNRRFTHLLKLCIIHAAARASTEITMADVIRANTVLAYAETQMPKAMGELGKSKTSEAAHKIMQALYATRTPLTIQNLWPIVRSDLDKPADLAQVISNLSQADKIQVIEMAGKKQGYLPKQKGISRQILYVNESLLKGKELP